MGYEIRPDRFAQNVARLALLSAQELRWRQAVMKPVRSDMSVCLCRIGESDGTYTSSWL